MTGRLGHRLAALEKRGDILARWAHVPAAQCPDAVLIAVIGQHVGWPLGYQPTDAELRAALASVTGDAA